MDMNIWNCEQIWFVALKFITSTEYIPYSAKLEGK